MKTSDDSEWSNENRWPGNTAPWRFFFAGFGFLFVDAVAIYIGEFTLKGLAVTPKDSPFAFWLAEAFVACFGIYFIYCGISRLKAKRRAARKS